MKYRGKMQQKTKQQLRDEIVTLTMRNKTLEITGRNAIREIGELEIRIEQLKLDIIRPTVAAYALLVTLTAIIIMEFVW